jgi:hypothetical protein
MVDIQIRRPIEMVERLNNLLVEYPDEVSRAVSLELNAVLAESKQLCPKDTGALRGSGHVPDPIVSDGNIHAEIGYSQGYAYWVHELIENYHEPPTQAKYLEVPLMRALPAITERIIARVEAMITR